MAPLLPPPSSSSLARPQPLPQISTRSHGASSTSSSPSSSPMAVGAPPSPATSGVQLHHVLSPELPSLLRVPHFADAFLFLEISSISHLSTRAPPMEIPPPAPQISSAKHLTHDLLTAASNPPARSPFSSRHLLLPQLSFPLLSPVLTSSLVTSPPPPPPSSRFPSPMAASLSSTNSSSLLLRSHRRQQYPSSPSPPGLHCSDSAPPIRSHSISSASSLQRHPQFLRPPSPLRQLKLLPLAPHRSPDHCGHHQHLLPREILSSKLLYPRAISTSEPKCCLYPVINPPSPIPSPIFYDASPSSVLHAHKVFDTIPHWHRFTVACCSAHCVFDGIPNPSPLNLVPAWIPPTPVATAQAWILHHLGIHLCKIKVVAVKPIPQARTEATILQGSIVQKVNANPNAGWKASMDSRFSNYTVGQFKYILGAKKLPQNALEGIPVKTHPKSLKLPAQFDARTAWPQCSTIGKILDQGHCGSCWAFGAVESLSDRFCIHFDMNISLSVNDLLSCCGFMCGDGCDGGYPISAWRYFVQNGVVTDECDPYFDQKGCAHPGCEPLYPTPQCEKKCKVKNLLWDKTKHFSVSAYRVSSDPQDIMAEVYKNGPVEVAFTVYEDFAHYKSGVYKHVTGEEMGGHAVKLIGWGTSDGGEDYWLLANQWNRGWGDDGYFKIVRGTNECGIEEDVVAGLPSSKNLFVNVAWM